MVAAGMLATKTTSRQAKGSEATRIQRPQQRPLTRRALGCQATRRRRAWRRAGLAHDLSRCNDRLNPPSRFGQQCRCSIPNRAEIQLRKQHLSLVPSRSIVFSLCRSVCVNKTRGWGSGNFVARFVLGLRGVRAGLGKM